MLNADTGKSPASERAVAEGAPGCVVPVPRHSSAAFPPRSQPKAQPSGSGLPSRKFERFWSRWGLMGEGNQTALGTCAGLGGEPKTPLSPRRETPSGFPRPSQITPRRFRSSHGPSSSCSAAGRSPAQWEKRAFPRLRIAGAPPWGPRGFVLAPATRLSIPCTSAKPLGNSVSRLATRLGGTPCQKRFMLY